MEEGRGRRGNAGTRKKGRKQTSSPNDRGSNHNNNKWPWKKGRQRQQDPLVAGSYPHSHSQFHFHSPIHQLHFNSFLVVFAFCFFFFVLLFENQLVLLFFAAWRVWMKTNVFLGEREPQFESGRALGSSGAGSDVDSAGMNEMSSKMNESCGARAVNVAASVNVRLSRSLTLPLSLWREFVYFFYFLYKS